MAISHVELWKNELHTKHGYNRDSTDLRYTDQAITFDSDQEIGVGMIFPIHANGMMLGKGYYQLIQQQKQGHSSFHEPVMVEEVLSWLITDKSGIYLDCTIGGGGHAQALLRRLAPSAKLLGMDQDDEALAECNQSLSQWQNQVTLKHANFKLLDHFLQEEGIEYVDGILMDLGISSHQIDTDYRGFSFMRQGPLDMRMNRHQKIGAFHVINTYSEQELRRIIFEYGEERRAAIIAKQIVRARENQPIDSTTALAAVIAKVVHPGRLNRTLARVFQGVRIEVNAELVNLQFGLEAAVEHLKKQGRICVISFHSLEDRLVKQFFRENEGKCICPPELPKCICNQKGRLKILTKHPITPPLREIETGSRGLSSKLRVAERV